MIKESVWTIGDVNPKCPFNRPNCRIHLDNNIIQSNLLIEFLHTCIEVGVPLYREKLQKH